MGLEYDQNGCKLLYNTERKSLRLPEYGRNVQKMIEYLRSIPDREQRNQQARAVVKVMEILNPQVHLQENYEQKLWDHLFIISDFDLDVDSPYPMPSRETLDTPPAVIPVNKKPVKAYHYGRNIENMIDLVAQKEDGEVKTAMIRSLAIYMRQQYLIWNKDSVSEETIFQDIERLSDGRISVPEGLHLSKVSPDSQYGRQNYGQNQQRGRNGGYYRNNRNGGPRNNHK